MRFQVPQFIEIEDKIVGNLTLKQFVYLAGGAGMTFVAYKFIPSIFGIIIALAIVVLSLALAFYKINNKPFEDTLEAAIKFYTGTKLYVWKKTEDQIVETEQKTTDDSLYIPKLSDSKLKELSWSLDIKQSTTTKDDNKSL